MENRRIFRNSGNKFIAGVASGIAEFFSLDVQLVRFAFIISAFFGGFGIIAYIVCWILFPEKDSEYQNDKKIFRNLDENKLGGVAAGIAEYIHTDVNIIRAVFILTTLFGGAGLFIYILCWIMFPAKPFVQDIHTE